MPRGNYCEDEVSYYINEFVDLILHGSDEHKDWLLDAAKQYIIHGTVPPPRG